MSGPWENDEPEYFVLDPLGQVLDSFAHRSNAEAFARAHDDAIYVEARQQRRRTVWSAFEDMFQ